jgi:hypothetical protein
MKILVTMKDPDTLYDAIKDATDALPMIEGLTPGEMALVRERRAQEARTVCHRWFEHGEYLTVEVDTETETCVVVPKEAKP